jgi:hypothetical protein
MADTHDVESRPATARSRPDVDSLRAGLARMRSGDPDDAASPRMPSDEDNPSDDANDHGDDEPAPTPRKPAKSAKNPIPEDEDEPVDEATEDELEDPPADEPELEDELDEPEPEAKPEPKPDPELERRASQLRKQEQRMRERVRSEREEVARDRESLKSERAELEQFKTLKARAKYDTWGVLKTLGLTEDDAETAAKHIYSFSKELAKDPKNREAADRAMRERERDAELAEMRSWRKQVEDEKRETAQRERERADAVRYLGSVQKAAKSGTLAAYYLGKGGTAADRAVQSIASITAELADDDELPDPNDVLGEYERRRRTELEDDGVDVDALLKRKAAPPAKPGDKKSVAKPATKNGTHGHAKPVRRASPEINDSERKPLDSEERKDQLLRDLSTLRKKKQDRDLD